MPREEYEAKKEVVADAVVARLQAFFPGLKDATIFRRARGRGAGRGCWVRPASTPRARVGAPAASAARPPPHRLPPARREVGTPRTHRRFLNRSDGSYGPIPSRRPLGMLGMPFNRTAVQGLYCVGDSTFPGQGVNAGGGACGWVASGGSV